MTIDGIAAVEARIAQIQRLISGSTAGAGRIAAPTAAPSAVATRSPEFASLLANATATGTTSPVAQLAQLGSPTPESTTAAATTQSFLSNALAEKGKPYVYGATASITDPDPKAFDCSELTKWAAARAGITIPDGATAQYLDIRDHGNTMSVQQALHTPGALLFHFSHEPRDLGDIPADGHVAISVGDGVHTIEARGRAYGTDVFGNASGRSFNFAGMIPGMT